MPRQASLLMDADQFKELAVRLGAQSRGTDQTQLVDAARSVRDGVVISVGDVPALPAMADDVSGTPGIPAPYRLDQWTESAQAWNALNDRISIDVHGATSMTHIDTTEHFSWGNLRQPQPPEGALMHLARNAPVGRGILLDIPAAVGRKLESGEVVTLADLNIALDLAGTMVAPGDALYISFGRKTPAHSDVSLGSVPLPGLSIECAEWIATHRPSVIITDEGLDPFPSEVEGLLVPWHVLLLTVLDIPLVDRAQMTRLADYCTQQQRWEFLSVIAPLPIPGASGSPVNPLAVF